MTACQCDRLLHWHKQQVRLPGLDQAHTTQAVRWDLQLRVSPRLGAIFPVFPEALCHLRQGASALEAWPLQEKAAGRAGSSSWGARSCAPETPYVQKVFEWQEC